MKISKVYVYNIFMVLFISYVKCNQDFNILNNVGEVVFVNMLYRHGDRTPFVFYPTDPYNNISYWPEGIGQLTKAGKFRLYELGKWLRKRYIDLIPSGKYSNDYVYIQSTDFDRTLMSASANLAGMFPPTEDEQWSQLKWQPIPVHTIPKELDKVIFMEYPCPKFDDEMNKLMNSTEMKTFQNKVKPLYKYLTKWTGENMTNLEQIELLYNTLLVEEANNYTLPTWTRRVYPDPLKILATISFSIPTYTNELKLLRGGPLLKDMIKHFKEKRSGTLNPDRNIWIYSGHDRTIVNLLNTMGVFQLHCPPLAALIILELRKNSNNKYFVTVLYKTSTEEPTVLKIPGCTPVCPLDKFESLLQNVIPKNWDDECKIQGSLTGI